MPIVTIQHRRGKYDDFDKTKMLPGEPAAVLMNDPETPSGKAFYVCFGAGDVRRLVSIEDLDIMINDGRFTGPQGSRGIGVKSANIDNRGHLILTLDDNTLIDAGFIDDALERLEEAKQAAKEAKESAESAKKDAQSANDSKNKAANSEKNAKNSELASKDYEENAALSESNALTSEQKAKNSELASKDYANDAKKSMDTSGLFAASASSSAEDANKYKEEAASSASAAAQSENNSDYLSKVSESHNHGNTGVREGENADNSKYWSERSRIEADRAQIEADRAARYSEVIAPSFIVDIETMMLYMRTGVKVDFIVVDDNYLCWALD